MDTDTPAPLGQTLNARSRCDSPLATALLVATARARGSAVTAGTSPDHRLATARAAKAERGQRH